VNYCHLSAPGYKEEDLRVGETQDIVWRAEQFNLTSLKCSSCYRSWNTVESMELTPNTSRYFNITDDKLIVRETGVYMLVATWNRYIQLYSTNNGVILEHNKSKNPIIKMLEKGEEMWIDAYRYDNFELSFLVKKI